MEGLSPGAEPVLKYQLEEEENWEVLMWFDSEAAAWVSGAAETVDYFW